MSTNNMFLWRDKKKYQHFCFGKEHLIWSYDETERIGSQLNKELINPCPAE